MAPPSLRVVVLIHNDAAFIGPCLASLVSEPDVEVVVVDNASTDGGADVVRATAPQARLVVNQTNRGFSAGCNQGAMGCEAPFLLFLNPDTRLLPQATVVLRRFLEEHPEVGAVGPRQWVDGAKTWQWSVVPFPPDTATFLLRSPLGRRGLDRIMGTRRLRLHRSIWYGSQPVRVPFLSGACLMVRREAFERVGGFDERFFIFFEDVDLCRRLRGLGFSLAVVPDAGIIHRVAGTVGRSPTRGEVHLRQSGTLYLQRHASPLAFLLWRLSLSKASRGDAVPPQAEHRVLSWNGKSSSDAWRLEVSPDPAFLFGASAQLGPPPWSLPPALGSLTAGRPLFWRAGFPRGGRWVWSGLKVTPPVPLA